MPSLHGFWDTNHNLNNRTMDMTFFKVKITYESKTIWRAKRLFKTASVYHATLADKWCVEIFKGNLVFSKYYTRKNNAIRAAKRELLRWY